MSAAGPTPDRRALRALSRTVLSRGSRFKPEVARIELAAGPAILKDCAPLPGWSRWLARWLLRRELRALARLEGLEGFPPLLARPDRDSALIGLLPGRPLEGEAFARDARRLAELLRRRVSDLHARRVYHLDLRQRQNLLLDEEGGTLNVVDFGAALAPGRLGARVFGPLLGWVDRQAALKYLARFAPGEMSREEARSYLRGQRWRRLWVFSPHRNRGAADAVRRRLQDLSG